MIHVSQVHVVQAPFVGWEAQARHASASLACTATRTLDAVQNVLRIQTARQRGRAYVHGVATRAKAPAV